MKSTANRLLLEDYTPYHKSLKWKIQDIYYHKRGNNAWLKGEVPYQITSNSVAAMQNAQIVYAAIEEMEREGALKGVDKCNVLEIASGVGLFAINFINAFIEIDNKKGKKYIKKLHYLFTDYSKKNLIDANNNKTINNLQKKGILDFYLLDALKPQYITPLTTKKTVTTPPLTAIIANYVHCCLPVKIIRKVNGKFYEKYIKLWLKKTSKTKDLTNTNAVLNQINNLTENLEEETTWKGIGDSFFLNEIHKKTVEKVSQKFIEATIIYPYGSLKSIENSLPLLIKGGIILISDKGDYSIKQMKGKLKHQPSIHGNSLAHSVNLPVIESFVSHLGSYSIFTKNPFYPIQTILIERNKNIILSKLFKKLFIQKNDNVEAMYFYRAGYYFGSQKDFRAAMKFFNLSLDLGSKDTNLYFYYGRALTECKMFEYAIKILNTGKKCDYFNLYDYNFFLGYSSQFLTKYINAIDFYTHSNNIKYSEITFYNIGKCFEKLNRLNEAIIYYKKALISKPQYLTAQTALKRLQNNLT